MFWAALLCTAKGQKAWSQSEVMGLQQNNDPKHTEMDLKQVKQNTGEFLRGRQ